MEKVAGIGGLFFRAHDLKALGQWYQQHLGIALTPTSEGGTVWQQEAGPTVFSPFPEVPFQKTPSISAIPARRLW